MNMIRYKFFLLVLFSISFCRGIKAQCPPGDILFSSQEDISDFVVDYPNCSEVTGSLLIKSIEFAQSNISDLSSLDGLTSIEGDLVIERNGPLLDLEGLENVLSIGGNLKIYGNDSLTSLQGLDGIAELGGNLDVSSNFFLTSLDGFEGLSAVNEYLNVFDNANLVSIQGLENITTVGGELYIGANTALESLGGLENLSSVGGRLALVYTILDNVEELGNLTSIGGEILLVDNFVLTSLQGLENIAANTITDLQIRGNPQLWACSVESICNYLGVDINEFEISENATGCESREAILATCAPTSVNTDLSNVEVEIFPNPTSGYVQFRNIEVGQIHLFNAQGQSLGSYQVSTGQILDLQNFPSGIYHLQLITTNANYLVKVVKQ